MQMVKTKAIDIPALGLGTYKLRGKEAQDIVEAALETGYRHIDTAVFYENEAEVGAGIKASALPRDQIFLTTKIWPDDFRADDFRKALDASLKRLQVDAVDLLLLHWPNPVVPLKETIGVLNEAKDKGLARSIGISNFTTHLIREAVQLTRHPLAVNQVEYHPRLDQSKVLAELRASGMGLTAYQPLGRGEVLSDPVLVEIAGKHGKTPGQVCLRWLVQQDGVIAIPKTAQKERLKENLDIFGFELSEDEMKRIFALARPDGRITDPEQLAPAWD